MLCKNCKIELANEGGFCQDCGARVIRERISLKFLFNEFLDKVMSIDNKLLKTFLHLFSKPHIVIDSYINGVRKRYYNPVSYLLISVTLGGIYLYFFKDIAAESFDSMQQVDPANPFMNQDFGKKIYDLVLDYQAFFTAINIPIYAFFSWIIFLNRKKYNYYEHIVIYLYTIAQIGIFNFIVILPFYFFDKSFASNLFLYGSFSLFIYLIYVLIRLFKLTFAQFIIKGLYFLGLSLIAFMIMSILMVVGMFMYFGPEKMKQMGEEQERMRKEIIRKKDSIEAAKKDTLKTKILAPR